LSDRLSVAKGGSEVGKTSSNWLMYGGAALIFILTVTFLVVMLSPKFDLSVKGLMVLLLFMCYGIVRYFQRNVSGKEVNKTVK